MVYTEIQEKKGKKYYYRVKSVKRNKKTQKERMYLGVNLSKDKLKKKEKEADRKLNIFEAILTDEDKKFLEGIKRDFAKEPIENYDNRYETFCSLFTYDSTGIEGSTLTLTETSLLLFEGIVPKDKSMREVYEVLNHKKAFDYILEYKKDTEQKQVLTLSHQIPKKSKGFGDITKEFICELHRIIVANTLKPYLIQQIGRYRTVQVRVGASFPPMPQEVHKQMASLLRWYSINKKKLHPLVVASYFYNEFERIHPFIDGNGRVGRLLMNFILHKNKYPMINIPQRRTRKHFEFIRTAHKGNLRPFVKFLISILKKDNLRF